MSLHVSVSSETCRLESSTWKEQGREQESYFIKKYEGTIYQQALMYPLVVTKEDLLWSLTIFTRISFKRPLWPAVASQRIVCYILYATPELWLHWNGSEAVTRVSTVHTGLVKNPDNGFNSATNSCDLHEITQTV